MRSNRDIRVTCAASILLAAFLLGPALTGAGADYGGYRPHFQGYGVKTPGGRGGAVIKVTNLNDAGPGSLRAALTAVGPRIVVFEISGTIALSSPIEIKSPFVTIAGQTAPSPGITVRNYSVIIDTSNVVFQHVRLRMGDISCVSGCSTGGADSLYIRNNAYNVVLDHLSISWGTHGGLSINAWSGPRPYDIAMFDSIVSENLTKPINPYGIGTLFLDSPDGTATFARNLHAHNGNRQPWVGPGWQFSGYNNVAYNAASIAGDQGALGFFQIMGGYNSPYPVDAVWIGNVALPGPNTHPDGNSVKISLTPIEAAQANRLYLADNTGPHQTLEDQWERVTFQEAATAGIKSTVIPSWHASFKFAILPNASVLAHVLANAGARPLDRDSVDTRVVSEVLRGGGSLINSQTKVGGWPALAVNTRPFVVPANANAPGNCGTTSGGAARTVIECTLESMAQALEPGTGEAAPATTVLLPPSNLRLAQ